MNAQELKDALSGICNGTSWTTNALQMPTRWRCEACGREISDSMTVSASLVFGPHYKPGREPRTFDYEVK